MSGEGEAQESSTAEKRERPEEEGDSQEPPSKQPKTAEEGGNTTKEESASNENQVKAESAEVKATDSNDPSAAAEAPSDKQEAAQPETGGTSADKEKSTTDPPAPAPTVAGPTPAPVEAPVPVPAPAPAATPAGLPPSIGSAPPAQTGVASAYTPPSAFPNATVEERGEVPSLYVGRIIGKGGEMIRDLQSRSGCRMDVDQNVPPGQPRVITYRGPREKVEFAKQLVRMLCQENVNEADLPLGEARQEFLFIPASSVGKVIGSAGSMIRELQKRSHSKIQVDHGSRSDPSQPEKQVTLTGTEQAVAKAREMIMFLVANPMIDAMQAISMLVEEKMNTGGVWGSGPPYMNLPNNGQNMQPDQVGYGDYGASGGYGMPYQQAGYGAQPQQPSYAAAAPPLYQQQPAQGGYSSGGVETEIFYAAKTFMGRIIGSKGATINDLQRRSACDLQINQDVPVGMDCEIRIRGSRQGIEMAKQMLREIIEIGPNHPYAGGNQNSGYGGGGYQQQGYSQGYGQSASGYGQYQQQSYGAQSGYQQPPPSQSVWKSAMSPSGQVYYYNEQTGQTTWEKPPGMP